MCIIVKLDDFKKSFILDKSKLKSKFKDTVGTSKKGINKVVSDMNMEVVNRSKA